MPGTFLPGLAGYAPQAAGAAPQRAQPLELLFKMRGDKLNRKDTELQEEALASAQSSFDQSMGAYDTAKAAYDQQVANWQSANSAYQGQADVLNFLNEIEDARVNETLNFNEPVPGLTNYQYYSQSQGAPITIWSSGTVAGTNLLNGNESAGYDVAAGSSPNSVYSITAAQPGNMPVFEQQVPEFNYTAPESSYGTNVNKYAALLSLFGR